jgi:hypothetical protein
LDDYRSATRVVPWCTIAAVSCDEAHVELVSRKPFKQEEEATMSVGTLESVRAEALFASDVQVSEHPTSDRVRMAVIRSVERHGSKGCAEIVAHEFGEHPETAARRMLWVLRAVRSVYPAAV